MPPSPAPAPPTPPAAVLFFGAADYTGGGRLGHFQARALRDAGYRVTAICGERPPAPAPSVIDALRADGIEVIEEHGFTRLLDRSLGRRCAAILRERQPHFAVSVLQIDAKIAALATRRAGVPLIVFAQSRTTFYGPAPLRRLKAAAYGWILRHRAARVICVAESVAEQARSEHGCPADRIVVLPGGVETRRYGPEVNQPPADLGPRQPGEIRLLTVGRLDEQKGLHHLLAAVGACAPQFPGLRLLIVGDATIGSPASAAYAARLRTQAAAPELAGRVQFLGWRNDVAALQVACDLYVQSALWEGLPLAVLEAMASARPVILTDRSGRPEGFTDGRHGLIVPADDPAALAAGITRLLALPEPERAALGRAARALVEQHHDVAAIGRRFVEHCREAVRS